MFATTPLFFAGVIFAQLNLDLRDSPVFCLCNGGGLGWEASDICVMKKMLAIDLMVQSIFMQYEMFWSPLLKMPPYSVSHLTDLQILIVLVLFLVTFHTFSPFSHPFLPWLGQDSFLPPFQLCQHTHLCKKWTPFALWTPYWRVCRLHRTQRSNAQTFVIVKKVCLL